MVAGAIICQTPHKVKGCALNIVHSTAFYATNMVVPLDISIETSLATAHVELIDQSHSAEQLEVAVHGTETDFRQPAVHQLIQPCRSWVRFHLMEFL